MMRSLRLILLLGFCSWITVPLSAEDAEKPVSYYRQVRPILQRHCSGCHQPAKAGGKLLLTGHAEFQTGGENGPAFVPGKPDDSLIISYISGDKPEMPLNSEPLQPEQIALISKWIGQGGADDSPASARDDISPEHPPVYHAAPGDHVAGVFAEQPATRRDGLSRDSDSPGGRRRLG